MKKKLLAFAFATSLIALSACGSGSGEIIVESSAGNVTKDEFYEMLKDRYGEQVLQEIVLEKVLEAEYKVTDEEIEMALDLLREEFGPMLDEQYSEDDLNRLAKFQLLQEKAVTKDVEISDEQVEEHYNNLKPELHAQHILIDKDDKKLAEDILKQLKDGADFAELAEEHSEDPGSAGQGGDLGWFGAGSMVAEFEEATYKLEKDEISDLVKSEHGWHIIQLLDKKEVEPLEDLRAEIEHELKLQQVDDDVIVKSIAEELEKAKVKINDDKLKGIFDQFNIEE